MALNKSGTEGASKKPEESLLNILSKKIPLVNERFFLKFPEEFQKGILVYPPSVNEVVGNKEFNSYRQLLLISQEDIEDRYIEKHREDEYIPTPFEFLLSSAYSDERILQLIKRAFHFFIKAINTNSCHSTKHCSKYGRNSSYYYGI